MLIFAGLLFAGIIRQNQPVARWRRHPELFVARVLAYNSALDARKARFARQRARPFGPSPVGLRAKILVFRILPAPAIRLRFAQRRSTVSIVIN